MAALLTAASCAAHAQSGQEPIPEAPGAFGFKTVAAALADLHSRPGVEFSTQNGWVIATDVAAKTLWSFAPVGNAAYPAIVKRQVVQSGDTVKVETKVLCEASKIVCDDLVRTFSQLTGKALGQTP